MRRFGDESNSSWDIGIESILSFFALRSILNTSLVPIWGKDMKYGRSSGSATLVAA